MPDAIKDLMFSKDEDDRELAVVLWLLFATRAGGDIWEAYAAWLPTAANGLPSTLLATDEELASTQNEALVRRAREARSLVSLAFDRVPFGAVPGKLTPDDLRWGYALVTSRAIAAEVGADEEGGADDTQVAVLAPCVDMANHVDIANVTALKKIGASDGGGLKGAYWRVVTGGSVDGGGGACCLETNRPIQGADEEVTISYQPDASNDELMESYGFSLRGNRNDRLGGANITLRLGAFRQAMEESGVLGWIDARRGCSQNNCRHGICVRRNTSGKRTRGRRRLDAGRRRHPARVGRRREARRGVGARVGRLCHDAGRR